MKKCLIIVDFQPDFAAGEHGFPAAVALAEPIARRMAAYHAAEDDVLITLDAAAEPVLYGMAEQARQPDDRLFGKACYGSAALFDHLRRTPYAAIEIVGVESHVCVLVNAVLAQTAQPDTPLRIGCIAGPDARLHEAALEIMRGLKMEIGSSGQEMELRDR